MSAQTAAPPRYHWGVPSARGLVLGLGVVRSGVLGVSIAAAAGVAYLRLPIWAAAGFLLAGVVYILAPGGAGRSAHETLTSAAGLAHRRVSGTARQSAGVPTVVAGRRTEAFWPRALGPLRIESVPLCGAEAGVVFARRGPARVATVVFGVLGPPRYRLLPPAEQAAAVAGWGEVLASTAAARSGIARLCWVERAVPAVAPAPHDDGGDDYDELMATAYAGAVTHHVYVGAQVRADDAGRARAEWELLAASMASAGLVAAPLTRPALCGLLRGYADGHVGPTTDAAAGPMAWRERWGGLETGRRLHRGFAVVSWPRLPVGPAWLDPLLADVPAGVERAIAVHLEPVSPARAAEVSRSARAAHALSAEQRSRWGFIEDRVESRQAAEADARESELVSGHGLHKVGAVVLVSAPDAERLESAADAVRLAAASSRLELRPIDGQHGGAWEAALPLCRLGWRRRP